MQRLRRWHRWSALVLALPLAVVGITGTALQAISLIYGETGPRRAPGEPLWALWLRDVAVTIHTGAFTGTVGVYLDLLIALGLLFFLVSGGWIFAENWRARRRLGRTQPFWRTRSGTAAGWRTLHRWTMLPVAAFLLLVAITGALLDGYFAGIGVVPLPPPRGPAGELAGTGGGEPPPVPSIGRALHDASLSLHKLNFLGAAGHALAVLIGAAVVALAVSGMGIYLAMLRQRRRAGRRSWFW